VVARVPIRWGLLNAPPQVFENLLDDPDLILVALALA
jgi:hypothetical protein